MAPCGFNDRKTRPLSPDSHDEISLLTEVVQSSTITAYKSGWCLSISYAIATSQSPRNIPH
jgi:hypothetical protein